MAKKRSKIARTVPTRAWKPGSKEKTLPGPHQAPISLEIGHLCDSFLGQLRDQGVRLRNRAIVKDIMELNEAARWSLWLKARGYITMPQLQVIERKLVEEVGRVLSNVIE